MLSYRNHLVSPTLDMGSVSDLKSSLND